MASVHCLDPNLRVARSAAADGSPISKREPDESSLPKAGAEAEEFVYLANWHCNLGTSS
jgi:hypothetical protein